MKKILMSLALAAVSAMAFAAQPSADDAKALVEQQAKTVFTKLNANQSRYRNDPGAFSDLIKSEVLPYMDFELMSQVVLGRHWRDASAQQKADFTAAFRDLLVRVYSRGWTNYAGTPVEEAVKILSTSPLDTSASRCATKTANRRPSSSACATKAANGKSTTSPLKTSPSSPATATASTPRLTRVASTNSSPKSRR